ncbi:helix-turn-helix transcriptional regulator [Actinocorallia sp. A-T 12471]|uniref:helix-turn-helix transcriptional regulator n=1 Tax=Actinocorallia sp. A-T 12471 TaxID=3089813 RepID=UPI0029D2080C|nr:helix-turn-helix transcriptional regulator [Actinocorallia sp. A-T 12471]MDX6744686.1 helix-turn-helix transcriptional regulator [Actinocorallia sp. A-T 12471]
MVRLRARTGMSQQELADLVPGWTQTKVGRVERGERDTLYDLRELLAFADAVGMPREALAPLFLGDPDAVAAADAPQGAGVDDGVIDRRTFAERTMLASAGFALPATGARPPERVTDAHLRLLQASLDALRTQDRASGGTGLVRHGVALFQRARATLDAADHTDRVGRELLGLCAQTGVIAGFVAYDADVQAVARTLFSESVLLAETSGDPALVALAYASMALHSTHLGRTTGRPGPAREALRLLDRATAAIRYERNCARLHALIEMRKAPAAALLGDAATARLTISAARRSLDEHHDDDESRVLEFVTPAEITGFEAASFLDLGKPAEALKSYTAVLAQLPKGKLYDRSRVYYRAMVAHSLHRMGDTAAALDKAVELIPAFENGASSRRALTRLTPLRATTTDESFTTRFDTLTTTLQTP